MNNLVVYLHGKRTGILELDTDGELNFTYDAGWLEDDGAVPLSRFLPLVAAMYRGKMVRPFFAGILPEEGPRQRIAEILGISRTNDFMLLERLGGECAGAVSLLPAGTEPAAKSGLNRRKLSGTELQDIVQSLHVRPLMADTEGVRLSLAGAQDKLPVIVNQDGCIYLPLGDTPSTYILKPEPDRFPGLAANEVFCMALARSVGLPVPEVEFRRIGEKPCIFVERYDRITDSTGSVSRIHQEDFCQALGLPPERKYQLEGGPMLVDCFRLLRSWSTVPVRDVPDFINRIIYYVIIGNADAHAKNFSFLYHGANRRLAPCYDAVSTIMWPDLSKRLAMKIGSCDSVNAFTLGDWKRMSERCGLAWPVVRERMGVMCEKVLDGIGGVYERMVGNDEVYVNALSETIKGRAVKLRDVLVRD